MRSIPGKLKAEDVPKLVELVKGKNVLQLGCYCGRGLLSVAKVAWVTWVLEDFRSYAGSVSGVADELCANVDKDVPLDVEINLLYGYPSGGWAVPDGSRDVAPGLVNVVYRDADRQEQLRDADDALALKFLRRYGGTYAWHDEGGSLRWLQVQPVPVEAN